MLASFWIALNALVEIMQESVDEGKQNVVEEELTCSVCLEQVVDGEIIRTLPCVHQVRISSSLSVVNFLASRVVQKLK